MLLQEMLQGLLGLLGFESGLFLLFFLPLRFIGIERLLFLTQFGQGTRAENRSGVEIEAAESKHSVDRLPQNLEEPMRGPSRLRATERKDNR